MYLHAVNRTPRPVPRCSPPAAASAWRCLPLLASLVTGCATDAAGTGDASTGTTANTSSSTSALPTTGGSFDGTASGSSTADAQTTGPTTALPTTSDTTTGTTTPIDPDTTATGTTGTTDVSGTTDASVCGDGVVEADELCDDGNDAPYDGCEPDCRPSLLDVQGGSEHVCALLGSGAVRCWGDNHEGQLGYGHTDNLGDQPGELPTPDVDLGGPVVELAVGSEHTCVRHGDGSVGCWGNNMHGQLGVGSTDNVGDKPGQMPPQAVPLDAPAIRITSGLNHSCALLDTGAVQCWGANDYGQLGVGTTETLGDEPGELPPPATQIGDDVERIVGGRNYNCVLLVGGEVRCWGEYTEGNLGGADDVAENIGDDPGELPTESVLVGGPVDDLTTGHNTVCARLGDQLRCWGSGQYGALGAGDTANLGGSPGDMPPPVVTLGGKVLQHSAGLGSCALMDDRKLRCWGSWLALGNGNNENIGDDPGEMPPVDVALPGPVSSIHSGEGFTLAIMVDGTLRAWGFNNSGQLGLGHTEHIGDDELPTSIGVVPVY